MTFDLGCGWLHSADHNSFVKIAEALDFEIDRKLPPWRERAWGKAFPPEDRDDYIRSLDEFFERLDRPPRAASIIRPVSIWKKAIAGIR